MFLKRKLQVQCQGVLQQFRTLSSSSTLSGGERRVSQPLPSTPARTRFAPSPTGYLHLGSLRTALFNYLLAKATGGQFILRVEDTDKKRTIPDAQERLYKDLRWTGLEWDEGPDVGGPYGPYTQSERTALYKEHAGTLLNTGHAYRCFCSSKKLIELSRRRAMLGLSSNYDRTCEGLPSDQSDLRSSAGEPFVIRLRVPAEPPEYVDLVYGSVGKPNHKKKVQDLGEGLYQDPILLKSDGLPTYHLANVVDDHHMRITHVVRAAEWMSSTPHHLSLYRAFGWEPPAFAHVGLLQDSSHQKFSKRKGDLNIRGFEEQGVFPETVLNYVALYGWSHTKTSDVLSLTDLVDSFDLKFTKGNTVVEPHKLMYLQKKYAAKYATESGPSFENLVDRVFGDIQREFEDPTWNTDKCYVNHLNGDNLKNRIAEVLRHTAKNYTTPKDFFHNYGYFFYDEPLRNLDAEDFLKGIPAGFANLSSLLHPCNPSPMRSLNRIFRSIPAERWTDEEELKGRINYVVDGTSWQYETPTKETYKATQLYLRWAITRGGSGPSLHITMRLLGRDKCLQRLDELEKLLSDRRETLLENQDRYGGVVEP